MRVLFVTQWFDPEPMFKGSKFVKALMQRGHHFEIVTGFPNYPTGKLYQGYKVSLYRREMIDGIPVHRVPLYPSHDRSSLRRMANYLSFCASAAIFSALHARRFDVLYAYSPITTGLVADFAGAVARRPRVIDVQDIWPDSVVRSGMTGTRWMRPILGTVCNIGHHGATAIVVQSQGMKNCLVERGVPADKVTIIHNFADEDAAAPAGRCNLAPYRFDGHFNFVFGGNLGRVQGLDTVIRAAHLAHCQVPNLRLLLIGDGIEADRLKTLVSDLKADNVMISPAVPLDMIGDVFAAADVLVVHLWDDPLFEITIPTKTQFYLAMGKPILVGIEGEAAAIIRDAGAGMVVPPQNVDAMAQAMVKLARTDRQQLLEMGRRARETYLNKFSFEKAVTATEAALAQAIAVWRGEKRAILDNVDPSSKRAG